MYRERRLGGDRDRLRSGRAAPGVVGGGLFGRGTGAVVADAAAPGLLWALLILLAVLLIQVRNWFGLWSILVSGAVVFGVSWWLTPQAQSAFAYVLTWFLLLAAPRPVLELQTLRHRTGARTSDADQLARLTMLPAIVWVGFFLVVTVGALVLGARWMVVAAA